jgi:hypothetical protein
VFPLKEPESKLWAHVSERPPRVSALRPELPHALDAVLARALAKDPRQRFDSAPAFAAAAAAATSPGRLTELLQTALAGEDDRLVRAIERVAARVRRLDAEVAELSPERIERQLGEIRARHVAGKAQLVDALAQQLSAARRARVRLDAVYDRLEQDLRDPDTHARRNLLDALARELEPGGKVAT